MINKKIKTSKISDAVLKKNTSVSDFENTRQHFKKNTKNIYLKLQTDLIEKNVKQD